MGRGDKPRHPVGGSLSAATPFVGDGLPSTFYTLDHLAEDLPDHGRAPLGVADPHDQLHTVLADEHVDLGLRLAGEVGPPVVGHGRRTSAPPRLDPDDLVQFGHGLGVLDLHDHEPLAVGLLGGEMSTAAVAHGMYLRLGRC